MSDRELERYKTAMWIQELRKELIGDILGKLEVLEGELKRLEARLDIQRENATTSWLQLEDRVKRIERELIDA